MDQATMMRTRTSGSSPEEAARILEGYYGAARLRVARAETPFMFRVTSFATSVLTLRLAMIAGFLRGVVLRMDTYLATWFHDLPGRIALGGRSIEVRAGQPIVLPSSTSFDLEAGPGRQGLLSLTRPFLESLAAERHGGSAQPITFRHDHIPTLSGVAAWRRTISAASVVLADAAAPALLRADTERTVGTSMLSVFGWHTREVPAPLLAPRLARVRTAVEFLHDNAHLPVTPADAAAAAGLHVRSLQNAFQRHVGISPTEYLRDIRLDRARRQLLEVGPESSTVAQVARAWGFGNLGRFAGAYQQRFGERPSSTLRR